MILIKPKQLGRNITKRVKKMQFSKKNIFFKKKTKKKKFSEARSLPSLKKSQIRQKNRQNSTKNH